MPTELFRAGTTRLPRGAPAPRDGGMPRAVVVAAAAIAAGAAVLLLAMGSGGRFYVDDWAFVLYRGGHAPAVFLEPHNEHLSLLPIVLYKSLLELVGMGHYGVFRACLVATNLVGAGLVLVNLSRAIDPWLALLLAAPLALMGYAWSDLFSPFQIGFAASMAAGMGALLALDGPTRRGDLLACGLLTAALLSSGLGLAWLVAAFTEIVLRDRRVGRLWIVAAPAVLYVIWFAAYGGGESDLHAPGDAVLFAFNSAAAATGAYTGLGLDWGRSLFVLLLALAAWRVYRLGAVPPRTAAAIAGALTFWVLTGLVRKGDSFTESRYLLPGAIFLVLSAGPLLAGARPSRGARTAAAVAAALAVLIGSPQLALGHKILTEYAQPLYARLTALELSRRLVPTEFQPDPQRAAEVTAGRYFAARDRFGGSSALGLGEVRSSPPATRREFDDTLIRAQAIALTPAPAPRGAPPVVESGRASVVGSCRVLGNAPVSVRLSPPGAIVDVPRRADAVVRLRRLGDDAPDAYAIPAPAGGRWRLPLRPDGLSDPWHARVEGPPGTRVCGAG
jgi:hypothetical protein